MATSTYKILGQSSPSSQTETVLYTVPSSTQAVVSSIVIANQAASSATYRIAVRPSSDGSTAAKHWVVYGSTVTAGDAVSLTLGITLAAGDTIRIYASTAYFSFSAFGSEIS